MISFKITRYPGLAKRSGAGKLQINFKFQNNKALLFRVRKLEDWLLFGCCYLVIGILL